MLFTLLYANFISPKARKKKKKKRRKRFFFPYSNKSMTIIQGVILFCLLTLAVV